MNAPWFVYSNVVRHIRIIIKTIEKRIYEDGIIKDIQEYLKDNASILDIGCKLGNTIFPFIDFNPLILVGIDKDEFNLNHVFRNFLLDRNNYKRYTTVNGLQIDLKNEFKSVDYWENIFPEFARLFKDKFNFVIDSHKGDINNYSIPSVTYDVIIASNVLHFLKPDEQNLAIENIVDGAKIGGKIFISVSSYEKTLRQGRTDVIFTKLNSFYYTYSHPNYPDEDRYIYTEEGLLFLQSLFPKLIKKINTSNTAVEYIFGK